MANRHNRFGLPDVIRISFVPFSPWNMPIKVGDKLRIHGLFGSMVTNITQSFNMSYELFPPHDGEYGLVLPNLTTNGQLKMLQDGHADIALGPFSLDLYTYLTMHMTPASHYTTTKILSGMLKPYSTIPVQLTSVFDAMTWILLAISCIVFAIILVIEYWFVYRMLTWSSITEQFFIVLQTVFQESTKARFTRPITQLMGGAFILASFILATSFTNQGKANLVVQNPTLRYDRLEQIVNNPKLIIYYPLHTPIHGLLMLLEGENGAKLRARMLKEGGLSSDKFYDKQRQDDIVNRKAVILLDELSQLSHVSEWCLDLAKTGRYYYLGTETINTLQGNLALSKQLPKEFVDAFNMKIMWLISHGVSFLRSLELFPGHFHCIAGRTNRQADEMEALNIDSVSYTFKLLIFMLCLSTVVFLIELLIHKLCQRRINTLRKHSMYNNNKISTYVHT